MRKSLKIGIISHINGNIGNNLTNYALWQYLTDMGFEAVIIDAAKGVPWNPLLYSRNKTKLFLSSPYPENVLEKDYGKDEIYNLNDKYDLFVVGSDQLFRYNFVKGLEFHTYMKWVRDDKYKISYATSFGTDTFEGDAFNKSKAVFYLRRFQKLSVREKSWQEILKNEFRLEAEFVLDPVFLCDRAYYEAMAKLGGSRLPHEKFTFSYILDIEVERERIIRQASCTWSNGISISILSKQLNDNDVYQGLLDTLPMAKVEELLAGILNCDFFITDSFHGVCFALIFHKQFCVVFDKENWRGWCRFKSLLETLGLTDRVIDSLDSYKEKRFECNIIHYEKVDSILSKWREKSSVWLIESIEGARGFKGNLSVYDLLVDMQVELKKSHESYQKELERQLEKIKSDIFLIGHQGKKIDVRGERNISDMEVVGWGAGDCFDRNYETISALYPFQYICDSAPEKWGKIFHDKVQCISPKQLSEMAGVLVVIMIDDVGVSFKIARQLTDMGIYNFDHVENWIRRIK